MVHVILIHKINHYQCSVLSEPIEVLTKILWCTKIIKYKCVSTEPKQSST